MLQLLRRSAIVLALLLVLAPTARAADTLCDPSNTNCRTKLLTLIQSEHVGIDVGFWFMQDSRYMTEIIKRWQAGVPVRILIDPQGRPDLCRQRTDDRRLPECRHSAAEAKGQRHPALEDDDLCRPGDGGVRIRQLQPGCVRAGNAVHELRLRDGVLHRRSRRREQLQDEVRRFVDRHVELFQLRQRQQRCRVTTRRTQSIRR